MLLSLLEAENISIHAPTRSATLGYVNQANEGYVFQSTHPQGVRHAWTFGWGNHNISIHAPTRSATKFQCLKVGTVIYFNPRTHKECDFPDGELGNTYYDFNPRTHKECDELLLLFLGSKNYFNTRTHKECDLWRDSLTREAANFNPRTHKECDD